jgi:hypothetical protein
MNRSTLQLARSIGPISARGFDAAIVVVVLL